MVSKVQYFSLSYMIFGKFLLNVFYMPVQTHYSWPHFPHNCYVFGGEGGQRVGMTDQDGDIPHPANYEDSHNNYTLPERLTAALSRSPTDSASCGRDEPAPPSQFPTNSPTDGQTLRESK